jgi:hypothetical protein
MPLRFWLDVGTLDIGSLGLTDPTITILSVARHLREVLLERGYDVGYRERTGGHDFVSWSQALAEGLPHLPASGGMRPAWRTPVGAPSSCLGRRLG